MIKDRNGQYSVDLIIAVGLFILSITTAFYYTISAFMPHYERFDTYASAYRISTLLCEDAGLNVTNGQLKTDWEKNGTINSLNPDWYNDLNTSIKRVGLSDYFRIIKLNSSYERCVPNVLNRTKVENFFNESWWNDSRRFDGQSGERLWRNLSILLTLNSSLYHYNVSLISLDGKKVEYQIGYPIPEYGEVAKFERLVVMDDVYNCIDSGGLCMNETSMKRLVVYVW